MNTKPLQGKRILVTGGTGSLGRLLIDRLISAEMGKPEKIIVFSRDEAKQHAMRMSYQHRKAATEEIIFDDFKEVVEFQIGDIRDYGNVVTALQNVDVVFNAAALKQVPTCEYFPFEATKTNIMGAENIVRAIHNHQIDIETVVGVSTDKACKPVNVMGMTKAIQERVFIQGNMLCPSTRLICVRYGNVLASRGSVVPLFKDQIANGGPVTVTTPDMTRFLLTLDQAVDTIFEAVRKAKRGETYVPRPPSSRIIDVAKAMIGSKQIEIVETGARPGEKIHEILVSEEEMHRTIERGSYYVIQPILPEIRGASKKSHVLDKEYSSADNIMNQSRLKKLIKTLG